MQSNIQSNVYNFAATIAFAPGTKILDANPARRSFTFAGNLEKFQLVAKGASGIGDKIFYQNLISPKSILPGISDMIEPFRKFCECEYGNLVRGEIWAISVSGAGTAYVTEQIELERR